MRSSLALTVIALALVAGTAVAEEATPATPSAAEEKSCGKVADDRVNAFIKLLSPPPCDSCAETQNELAELRVLQRTRTDAEAKHAMEDAEISLERFLAGAGIAVDEQKLAACKGFFLNLQKAAGKAAGQAKQTFCRPRPYKLANSGIVPLGDAKTGDSPAYPSGHTTYGTLVGIVLADMVPEKRQKLYERAADYGYSRMVIGVHYRSDVDAGRILGSVVAADEFANDQDFKTSYPAATACLREAVGFGANVAEAPKP